jgi:hypothetical protein
MGFRKADKSHCAGDSTEREGTYITLLSCLLYSVGLSQTHTDAYNTAFAHLTEEETAADA